MIVGLLGLIGSGKGTAASYLINKYDFIQDSFAASLKDACSSIFDWPRNMLEGDTDESREWRENVDLWWSTKLGIPNFSPRVALQLIGTDALRNNFHKDLWFLTLQNRIRKLKDKNVVISDVRFMNELQFIQDNNGIIIRITRGDQPVWYETAKLASSGDNKAIELMNTRYSHVHASEWSVACADADFVIENNTSVEDLKLQINDVMSRVL